MGHKYWTFHNVTEILIYFTVFYTITDLALSFQTRASELSNFLIFSSTHTAVFDACTNYTSKQSYFCLLSLNLSLPQDLVVCQMPPKCSVRPSFHMLQLAQNIAFYTKIGGFITFHNVLHKTL